MKTCTKILLTGLALVLIRFPVRAAPGDVDLSFDPGSSVNGLVWALAVQSDGKILVGGDFTTVHGALRTALARLNPDGTLDPTFSPSIAKTGSMADAPSVRGMALQPDGKIIIGGNFSQVNGIDRAILARLNPDGTLDRAFLNGQSGPNSSGCVALQDDGKILLGGSFTSVNGVPRMGLARLNSDGTLDSSFLNGLAGASGVTCLALQLDGKVLIGGSFTSVNGAARTNLARLNSDGTLDDAFLEGLDGPGGSSGYSYLCTVAVEADGRILLAGYFSTINGVARTNVARLNTDGSLDASFIAPAGVRVPAMFKFGLQADGKVLLGGASLMAPTPEYVLCRLNTDGSLDTSFAPDLPEVYGDGGVFSLVLDTSGNVLVGGGNLAVNVPGKFLRRLTSAGSQDETFNLGSTGPDNEVLRVATQADGRLLIGGRFTSANGVSRGHLARLMPDGSLDASFLDGLAGADHDVWCVLPQADGKIVIGGEFTLVNRVTRLGIARLNSDGSLDDSFVNDLGGYVYALCQQGDGKIIAGGTYRANNLARLNPDGSTDGSFLANMTGYWGVLCMTLQGDGKILIGGYFSTVNGASKNKIARLNADGSLDTSFTANVDQAVWSVAVQNDGKIVIGGYFDTPGNSLARLSPSGPVDASFNPAWAGGAVYSLALQSDGKILVGGGGSGADRTRVVRLNPDGSADASFTTSWPAPYGDVFCVLPEPEGKILLGGGFTAVNQSARSFMARLVGDYAPPVIIQGPVSQTAEIGSCVALSVRASGRAPLSYQWCFQGPDPITGVITGACYRLTSVQPAQSGAYTVIVSNLSGTVTCAPAMLQVVAPVERRPVPEIRVTGETADLLNVDYADSLSPRLNWTTLGSVSLTSTSGYYFDLTMPLPPQRFYRTWQTEAPSVTPSLDLRMVPAITLTGNIGDSVRVDCINQFGPTDAWFTLDTVTLSNTSQLYFEVSAWQQPPRLYRLVQIP